MADSPQAQPVPAAEITTRTGDGLTGLERIEQRATAPVFRRRWIVVAHHPDLAAVLSTTTTP